MSVADPFDAGWLNVGEGHRLYYEQSGNPAGIPAVLLHGGPGDGSRPGNRRFFDPETYRLIMFDQRGAGRSTPAASLRANTTQHLISDIECLREYLGVKQWLVSGGSWGSFLAMVYAIAHPDSVLGLVLRGVVLGGADQVDWWFYGREIMFPEAHERMRTYVPTDEQDDLLRAYYRRLADENPEVHMRAALSLREFMLPMTRLVPAEGAGGVGDPAHALRIGRLWTHYCVNRFFMSDNHILDNIAVLQSLPAVIVQGRYDMVTPFRAAYRLSQAWPEAQLLTVHEGGHSADDPAVSAALQNAHNHMVSVLRRSAQLQ